MNGMVFGARHENWFVTICTVPETRKPLGSVEVFCSYSHKDEQYRRDFETHVALMKKQNLIQIWQDRKIIAGEDWAGEIDSHLNSADIVMLFVSADFLASDYCYEKEMMRAMERHDNEKVPVVPVIVRQCDWHDAPFGKLQSLPTDGRPVTSWGNRDEAWTEVATLLKVTVRAILERLLEAVEQDRAKGLRLPSKPKIKAPEVTTTPLLDRILRKCLLFHKRRGEAPDKNIRLEVLGALDKIDFIAHDVTSGADQQQLDTYAQWYEYMKVG